MSHSDLTLRSWRILSLLLVCALPLLGLYLVTMAYSRLGPAHDEFWSLYSSPVVGLGGGWTRSKIDLPGFPIVLLAGSYHGALKPNLFSPLLALTRNLDVIRSANSVLMLVLIPVYLWGTKPIEVQPVLNKLYATIAIFLIPALYINAPLDTGQFIIPSLLMALAFSGAIRGQSDPKPVYYWVSYVAGLLIVYEKLTNLCFAIPICSYALYWLLRNRLSLRTVLVAGFLPVLFAAPYLYYFSGGGWTELSNNTAAPESSYLANMGIVLNGLVTRVIDFGNIDLPQSTLRDAVGCQALAYVIALVVIFSGLLTLAELVINRAPSSRGMGTRALTYLWFVFLSSILIQATADGLNRPWHFSLYWTIIIFTVGIALQQFSQFDKLRCVVFAVAGIVGVFAMDCFAETMRFVKSHDSVGLTSPAILDVAAFLEKRPAKTNLVCVNYSVCLPLVLLLGSHSALKADYAFALKSNPSAAKNQGLMTQIDNALSADNTILIVREVDIKENPKWLEFLNEGSKYFYTHADQGKYQRIESFDDGRGTKFAIFEKVKSS